MRVQVIGRTEESDIPNRWAVVSNLSGLPHVQAARFLAYLDSQGDSVNTIRAYAYGLAWYLTFLEESRVGLDDASNELWGQFTHWLRSPGENVLAFNDSAAVRERGTANLYLSAAASFYSFIGSLGEGEEGYRGYKRLADTASQYRRRKATVVDNVGHARANLSQIRLGPRVKRINKVSKLLTVKEMHDVLRTCNNMQERLFILIAAETGMRIGQILGLRHEDINTPSRSITVVPRDDNENLARAKSRKPQELPVTKEVVRTYLKYMHEEYGYLESDYVFVELGGDRLGRARRPHWVYGVVRRIRKQTEINHWSPHTFRHTFVTLALEAGLPIEIVSILAMHGTLQTTADTYGHISVSALRAVLIRAGVWGEDEL